MPLKIYYTVYLININQLNSEKQDLIMVLDSLLNDGHNPHNDNENNKDNQDEWYSGKREHLAASQDSNDDITQNPDW